MRGIVLLIIFFLGAPSAQAFYPELVVQESVKDTTQIKDPKEAKAYMGYLPGFPHTYEIRSARPFDLYMEVRIPKDEDVSRNVNGLIVREKERGGVTEVARLSAKDAEWKEVYEAGSNDTYLVGGVYFEEQVPAGVYRLEVSTPDNIERYVVQIGEGDPSEGLTYFEKIARTAEIKTFFGSSKLLVIVSPLVYIPLALLLVLLGAYYGYRRYFEE